jgi:hypothetical protein
VPDGFQSVDPLTEPEWVVLCRRYYRPVLAYLQGRRDALARADLRKMGGVSPEMIAFYRDVLLGEGRRYRYTRVKVVEQPALPLIDSQGWDVQIYRRMAP